MKTKKYCRFQKEFLHISMKMCPTFCPVFVPVLGFVLHLTLSYILSYVVLCLSLSYVCSCPTFFLSHVCPILHFLCPMFVLSHVCPVLHLSVLRLSHVSFIYIYWNVPKDLLNAVISSTSI